MKRKEFIKNTATIVATSGIAACTSSQNDVSAKATFSHMVYFWLKADISTKEENHFLAVLKEFMSKVKEIQNYYIGTPAGTNREVVDNSFNYSLQVFFKDANDQDVYQKHEAHAYFIKECQELWTKVKVYDSILMKCNKL